MFAQAGRRTTRHPSTSGRRQSAASAKAKRTGSVDCYYSCPQPPDWPHFSRLTLNYRSPVRRRMPFFPSPPPRLLYYSRSRASSVCVTPRGGRVMVAFPLSYAFDCRRGAVKEVLPIAPFGVLERKCWRRRGKENRCLVTSKVIFIFTYPRTAFCED